MPSQRSLARKSRPLRAVTPEEAASWSDGDSDATLSEPLPLELDEAWSYTFQVGYSSRISSLLYYSNTLPPQQSGDDVWVKTAGGNWRQGRVTGQTTRKGATRQVKLFPSQLL